MPGELYKNQYIGHTRIAKIILKLLVCQSIINFTFYPLDGPDHCHYAYHNEENEDYNPAKGIVVMFILSLITIVSCIILIPFLYLLLGVGLVTPKMERLYQEQKIKK